jgi:hypothetical protein
MRELSSIANYRYRIHLLYLSESKKTENLHGKQKIHVRRLSVVLKPFMEICKILFERRTLFLHHHLEPFRNSNARKKMTLHTLGRLSTIHILTVFTQIQSLPLKIRIENECGSEPSVHSD